MSNAEKKLNNSSSGRGSELGGCLVITLASILFLAGHHDVQGNLFPIIQMVQNILDGRLTHASYSLEMHGLNVCSQVDFNGHNYELGNCEK